MLIHVTLNPTPSGDSVYLCPVCAASSAATTTIATALERVYYLHLCNICRELLYNRGDVDRACCQSPVVPSTFVLVAVGFASLRMGRTTVKADPPHGPGPYQR